VDWASSGWRSFVLDPTTLIWRRWQGSFEVFKFSTESVPGVWGDAFRCHSGVTTGIEDIKEHSKLVEINSYLELQETELSRS
jgi:hypothetical protein